MPWMKVSRPTGVPAQPIRENGYNPIWVIFPPSMPYKSIMPIRMRNSWGNHRAYFINTNSTIRSDGKKWQMLADKSNNKSDVPHDYIELEKPVQARFIKLENIHMPTGKFAISGLRVFGNGNGAKPDPCEKFDCIEDRQG